DLGLAAADVTKLLGNGVARNVTLGVRPEDLELVAPDQGDVRGEVYVSEPMGREQVVDVRFGESAMWVLAPATYAGQIGDHVGIRVNSERIHVFDPGSGERLN
ncbi:MAG TPA: TOBE domain-containing protein, partial [Chloroflexota bacterium]|nr:TOBE domain-containing protein [Chloroflexota bacterium]